MSEPIVSIRNAVVSYREDTALRDVSIDIHRGEFIGVLGPNGAGKTTLLTLINGLGQRTEGEVAVLGLHPYAGHGHKVRKRVGYVRQIERIDPRLPITVRETVAVGLYGRLGWFKRLNAQHWQNVDKALEQVGMTHLAYRPIGHLSGGEYQRAAIARALTQAPEILLFDEPTASIDPKAQRDILSLIERLHHERNLTSLLVTHDLATLPAACRRIVLMKEGTLWKEGTREEMLKPTTLAQLYDDEAIGRIAPVLTGIQN